MEGREERTKGKAENAIEAGGTWGEKCELEEFEAPRADDECERDGEGADTDIYQLRASRHTRQREEQPEAHTLQLPDNARIAE
jgi:hypothetical protein